MKTILLVTDGKANDRRSVFIVARTIRKAGVTIKVLPVGRSLPRWQICKLASAPCSQNVEMATRWKKLDFNLNRFIAGTCPRIAPPTTTCYLEYCNKYPD